MSPRKTRAPREPVIRLKIQCPESNDHAKIVRLRASIGMPIAKMLGELLCGTSEYYIFKPQERSPIGRCLVCGSGPLFYEIEEFQGGELSIQGISTEAVAGE